MEHFRNECLASERLRFHAEASTARRYRCDNHILQSRFAAFAIGIRLSRIRCRDNRALRRVDGARKLKCDQPSSRNARLGSPFAGRWFRSRELSSWNGRKLSGFLSRWSWWAILTFWNSYKLNAISLRGKVGGVLLVEMAHPPNEHQVSLVPKRLLRYSPSSAGWRRWSSAQMIPKMFMKIALKWGIVSGWFLDSATEFTEFFKKTSEWDRDKLSPFQ